MTTTQKYVNVTIGGSVLLDCTFATTETTTAALTIQWEFLSKSAMTAQQVDAVYCSDYSHVPTNL